MARKTQLKEQPEGPVMMSRPRDEVVQAITDQIAAGQRIIADRTINGHEDYQQLRSAGTSWEEFTAELLRHLFTDGRMAAEFDAAGAWSFFGADSLNEKVKQFADEHREKLRCLESIKERTRVFREASPAPTPQAAGRTTDRPVSTGRVFVVHGRHDALKHEAARFLSRIGLNPVILAEQPNEGRTIIEKMEAHSDVDFAVVLLTADDIGGLEGEALRKRARQNVILELGFFVGLLGRKRVCAICEEGLELPSDVIGVGYVPYDKGGAWSYQLAKELKAADVPFDASKLL